MPLTLGVVRSGAKFSPINGTEVEHIGERGPSTYRSQPLCLT